MTSTPGRRVSIVVVNWNGLGDLRRCLPSLFLQRYDDFEVIVVDNASTDGSVAYVREAFPACRIVRMARNAGYAGAGNAGLAAARGDYVAVLNADTEVDPDWLGALVGALEAHPESALATPKILLMRDPSRVNACGNDVSPLMLATCRGLDRPAERYCREGPVPAVSGAAFVARRDVLRRIGLFDERFFIYYEDTDLSLRAMLAGYTCLFVPSAVVYHDYVWKLTPRKCFLHERNRCLSVLKTFRWRTLLGLAPALALAEVIVWAYVAARGRAYARAKLAAYHWLWANRDEVLQARAEVQARRRVGDRFVLDRLSPELSLARTTHPALARALSRGLRPALRALAGLARAAA